MTIYQNTLAGTGFLQGPTGAPGPAANTYIQEYEYIATQGQSTFSGNDRYGNPLSYVANTIFVVMNGSILNEVEEYSALDGSTITLNQSAAANDELIVYTFPPFNVANTYTQQQANTIFLKLTGGTISGNVNFANGSNFTVPVGNTAQRPIASAGFIRYNTDLNTLESANNTAWANVGSGSASSGSGVSWQPIQNTNFISVKNNGYLVNTATGNVTITLPTAPTLGDIVTIVDYAGVASANAFILYAAGNKIQGNTLNVNVQSSGSALGLVYTDSTRGWIPYSGFSTSPIGNYSVSYLIAAGGGGGGASGGGGAGGLITGTAVSIIPGTAYAISVGAGGSGSGGAGGSGTNTTFFGQTSIGGGGGGGHGVAATSGGSGGGGGSSSTPSGAAGTSGQGNSGGNGYGPQTDPYVSGGGGGAGATGGNYSGVSSGSGGAGLTSSITGTSLYWCGGGGGGAQGQANRGGANNGIPGNGGIGGGGGGANSYDSSGRVGSGGGSALNSGGAGTSTTTTGAIGGNGGANTGGGAGGMGVTVSTAGNGGSGVVIISYFGPQRASGGTITSSGGYTIHSFLSSGTFIS